MRKAALFSLALLVLPVSLFAGPAAAARPTVVVELYTAQGCASCGEAGGHMAKLADKPGVAPVSALPSAVTAPNAATSTHSRGRCHAVRSQTNATAAAGHTSARPLSSSRVARPSTTAAAWGATQGSPAALASVQSASASVNEGLASRATRAARRRHAGSPRCPTRRWSGACARR